MTDDDRSAETDHDDVSTTVTDGLAAHTTRFDATPPDTSAFEPLDPRLGDAEIIGLGEVSHGTRECFQCKDRLIRYLVTEHGVRTIAFEANLPEARRLDEYVVHGEGDPVAALRGLYFWIYPVESVLWLVEWLRAFNADRPVADRVRVAGFDVQYTQGAVESLRGFFQAVDPAVCDRHDDRLQTAADGGTSPAQDDRRARRIRAIDELVPALRTRIEANADDYRARSSPQRVEQARRDLGVLEQSAAYRAVYESADDGRSAETLERLRAVRDTAMADHAAWLRDRADERIVCWGHDAHLNRVAHRSRRTTASEPSMGAHLADRYGDGYLAVGFAAGQFGFRAMGPGEDGFELQDWQIDGPLPGTTEAAVATATDDEPALLDLRAGGRDERTADWLAAQRPHLSVGATYEPGAASDHCTAYAYHEAFDLVWYLPETTPARPI